jgi:hypothetical protein
VTEVEPYKADDLPEGAVVRDEPVAYHLAGDEKQYVFPGRRVIDVPGWTWPAARPEECQNNEWSGKWFEDKVLLCTGCGLDCT